MVEVAMVLDIMDILVREFMACHFMPVVDQFVHRFVHQFADSIHSDMDVVRFLDVR